MRSFFFSSRRRHTRCSRDWSSDVCSSDLGIRDHRQPRHVGFLVIGGGAGRFPCFQIGRASCRERVEISVGAVSLKKKKETTHREMLVLNEMIREMIERLRS